MVNRTVLYSGYVESPKRHSELDSPERIQLQALRWGSLMGIVSAYDTFLPHRPSLRHLQSRQRSGKPAGKSHGFKKAGKADDWDVAGRIVQPYRWRDLRGIVAESTILTLRRGKRCSTCSPPTRARPTSRSVVQVVRHRVFRLKGRLGRSGATARHELGDLNGIGSKTISFTAR